MIIFMGVAGSGKSVQGRMLADAFGYPWLSTGEFLRMLISGQRRLDMLEGKLLEDAEMIALMQKIFTLVNSGDEFVLDGFPRTVPQADWLLSQVKYGQLKVSSIIHLVASKEVVMERLLSRGRPDDYREAIGERFREYDETILPMLDHFSKASIDIHEVDGAQSVAEVHYQIRQLLKPAK